jgi:hypothetical protein
MSYARATTVDSGPTGDTVVQAVLDLDADLTTVFANLNTHEALTTASHGLTSGEGDIVGTDALQTLTRKTITSPTITGGTATNLVMTGLSASLPVFTSSNSTLTSKSVADTLTALGIGAWTDYSASSTVVGWAATPTKEILYCKVGKIVFVSFYITGTSNATGASFTLPDTASGFNGAACRVKDNGSWLETPGWIDITGAATVSISVNCGDGSVVFTSSGAKVVHGTFAYGIA